MSLNRVDGILLMTSFEESVFPLMLYSFKTCSSYFSGIIFTIIYSFILSDKNRSIKIVYKLPTFFFIVKGYLKTSYIYIIHSVDVTVLPIFFGYTIILKI